MAKPDMMICIGPANLILRDFRQALTKLLDAMNMLEPLIDHQERPVGDAPRKRAE